jgi:hypothetical protein
MKRKHRNLKTRITDNVRVAIANGVTDNRDLRNQCVVPVLMKLPLEEIFEFVSRGELSSAKQRLRDSGEIEMVRGNVPKPIDQLTQLDAEQIANRRARHIYGELETMVEFGHRFGLTEYACAAASQMKLFATSCNEDEESIEVEQGNMAAELG